MPALPRGEAFPDRSTTRPIISIFASGGFVASDQKAGLRIRFPRKWSPQNLIIPRRTAIAMASGAIRALLDFLSLCESAFRGKNRSTVPDCISSR